MKKASLLFILSLFLFACEGEKKEKNTEESSTESLVESNSGKQLRGEFIYVDGAAVLKGRDFIYGVVIDEKGKELIEVTEEKKQDEYDMIPVLIRGEIIPNTVEDGWEELVEVKDILRVYAPSNEEVIRVESATN